MDSLKTVTQQGREEPRPEEQRAAQTCSRPTTTLLLGQQEKRQAGSEKGKQMQQFKDATMAEWFGKWPLVLCTGTAFYHLAACSMHNMYHAQHSF